ncbi:YncE family protein [Sinomicrobium pectinilyticum]|uniref:YncE family protein n=1 Tax=Sinomicrobium pectinilyticum TaxID=1084421 RepID=A0A3N0E3G9_SINP1|nr:YncE family protein [Sinomicrobium pectinilyticum]RNL82378.1 YncE family protein [Sinomicrobium pectinilyticum]
MIRSAFLFLTILLVQGVLQAQTPDVLVVNKIKSNANLPGSLAFMDYESGKVIKTVPVGNEPHEVCISTDKKYALVTNTGSYREPGNTLSLINIDQRKEIHRIDLGALWNPHGLTYHDGLFYFTAEGSRVIGAYDPEADKLVWINGTGQDQTHMLVVTQDGKYIIATNRGSNSISIYERRGDDPLKAGSWTHTILPVGQNPEGLDLSPDGKQVWVGLRHNGEIAVVDIAGKKVVDAFDVAEAEGIARVKFSSDGKYLIAADSRRGHVIFINPETHKTVKTIALGESTEPIFIHPDGKHICVGVTSENFIAEIDLATLEISRKLTGFKGPDAMAWIGK